MRSGAEDRKSARHRLPRDELRSKSSIALPAIELASYASRRSASNVRYGTDLTHPPRRGGMTANCVRREKAALSSGCKSHPANAPAGSNRSSHGGDEMAEAFGVAGHV